MIRLLYVNYKSDRKFVLRHIVNRAYVVKLNQTAVKIKN